MTPTIYSMSSVGDCARTITAKHLGIIKPTGNTLPEYLRLSAREGSRHEAHIREDLPEHGYKSVMPGPVYCTICDREGIHVEIDLGHFKVIGHMDDLVVPTDGDIEVLIAEYKALGKFTHQKLKDKGLIDHRRYGTQVALYQYAYPGLLRLVYVNKSRDTGAMDVQTLDESPWPIEEIFKRLYSIDDYIQKGELAPCDFQNTQDTYSCTTLCGVDNKPMIIEPGLIPKGVLTAIQQHRTAKILEEQAKTTKTTARKKLMAYIVATNKKSVIIDEMQLTRIPETTRTVFEVPPEIQQEINEVMEEYKIEKHVPALLRITDKKDGNDYDQ